MRLRHQLGRRGPCAVLHPCRRRCPALTVLFLSDRLTLDPSCRHVPQAQWQWRAPQDPRERVFRIYSTVRPTPPPFPSPCPLTTPSMAPSSTMYSFSTSCCMPPRVWPRPPAFHTSTDRPNLFSWLDEGYVPIDYGHLTNDVKIGRTLPAPTATRPRSSAAPTVWRSVFE